MNLTRIFFIVVAILAIGNFLLNSGTRTSSGLGWYLLVIFLLAGGVLYLLRDGSGGFRFDAGTAIYGGGSMTMGPRRLSHQLEVIHHTADWSVVARGDTVGMFRNAPISAWIRTSDEREADYCGITNLPLPEQYSCIEIPATSELILPPGLVYHIRS
ncbi:MAG: hypothetical protein HQL73_06705 [Magnetococcales bacterium]|nr:hypothetical protein [Magnetococcales bacterium]